MELSREMRGEITWFTIAAMGRSAVTTAALVKDVLPVAPGIG